jgi:hypothetical protein
MTDNNVYQLGGKNWRPFINRVTKIEGCLKKMTDNNVYKLDGKNWKLSPKNNR